MVEALGSKVRSHMTMTKAAMNGTATVRKALDPRRSSPISKLPITQAK